MSAPPAPGEFLLGVAGQVLLARCIGIAARLGLADRLAAGPADAASLAAASGVRADGLYRVLRLLASHGVFREHADGRFALSPRAELLRREAPGSLYALFSAEWQDLAWDAYRRLPDALVSGEPAFELAHGEEFFTFLAAHPDAGAAFDAAMARISAAEEPVIAAGFDFARFGCVMDVGGGSGGLLAAVLARYPEMSGILFDRPQVVAEPRALAAAGLLDRCRRVPGDFFGPLPTGADLVMLKRIVHDWTDADAVRLLANCRAALPPAGRLLVIDAVLAGAGLPDPNLATDVSLLVLTRGRERTAGQFEALLDAAGLRLVAIHALPPPATLALVEATPA